MGIKKIIILIILFMAVSFIVYKYFDYTKKMDYLKDLYQHGGAGIVADVEYILNSHFEVTGELPEEKSFRKSLLGVSEALFSKGNYVLEINHSENYILLYSYGPFEDDNGLENLIDARLYQNKDGDYSQGYNFKKYLFNGGYDILFFKGKVQYDCNERSDHKTFFYSKENDIYYENAKSEVVLDSILSNLELKSGYSKDYKTASVFIYDNKKESLNFMCSKSGFKIGDENKKKLLSSLKEKFSDYKYIKFSVAPLVII